MVVAVDVQTSSIQWQAEVPGGSSGASPALADGVVFVAGYAALIAFEAGRGSVLWQTDLTQNLGLGSSPVVSGDTVYVGETRFDWQVSAFDAATGDMRWQFNTGKQTGISTPAVADGVLFITTGQSILAIDASAATPAVPATPAAEGSPESGSVAAGMERGGPARTGEQPGPGPTGRPVEQWRIAGSPITGEPVVVGDVVYVASGGGGLGLVSAIDVATGSVIWSIETNDIALGVTLAVSGKSVFVGTNTGELLALVAASGTEQWTFQAADQLGSPVVANGVVYAGDRAGNLYAVDVATGALLWQEATGSFGVSPAVANGMVIAGGGQDSVLYAFDAATGEEIWRVANGSGVGASPVISESSIFIIGPETTLLALDLATGMERWRVDIDAAGGLGVSFPAVANGVVYVVDAGALHAIDAVTGSEIWAHATPAAESSPSIAHGVVYLAGVAFDGTVTAIDAATGAELWQAATGEMSPLSAPAVADEMVIIGSYSNLIALGDGMTP
jgi:outer membrane protein assembly factor BamB